MTVAAETRQNMYPLRAVDRVCDIIDLLAHHPSGIPLSTLAATVSLPKSSAFRYLAALESRGYVTRSDDGIGYRLDSPIESFGTAANGRVDRVVTVAKPIMARLTSSDVLVCILAALDGTGIRYLWVTSTAAPTDRRFPAISDRDVLHTTALGKVIASQLADEKVLSLLDAAGTMQQPQSTVGSPTELLRELHRIRGEGFAVSDNERSADIRSVAVPVGGETLALGIAGRSDRLPPEKLGAAVRQLRRVAVVLARALRNGSS